VLHLEIFCSASFLWRRTTHLFGARVAFTEPDPEIGYRFTPASNYWFFGENDHPVHGRINSLGWRDRERTLEKPDGVYRVAVMGDSYVEALQVELDSTFVAITERRLNELLERSGVWLRVECMNFGRSGMTTTEELIVLEREVLPCNPDAVVVLFMPGNDIADIDPATASDALRPFPRLEPDGTVSFDTSFTKRRAYRLRASINTVKQHSAIVSVATERFNVWRNARAQARVARVVSAGIGGARSLCTSKPDTRYLAPYATNKALLAGMARLCHARGARMWIMSVPPVRRAGELGALLERDPSFDPAFFDRDLGALADSSGTGFVPLAERFVAREGAGGAPLFWAHFSYSGHREAAAALTAALAPAVLAD
jgi:hypothetical protein